MRLREGIVLVSICARWWALVATATFISLAVGVTAGATLPTSATAANVATVAKAGSTEMIHTTANHPWLTADRGWVVTGALRSGEAVVTLDGQRGMVVSTQAVAGYAEMDNLTVADDHTYAVGSGQWVVHNVGPSDYFPITPQLIEQWWPQYSGRSSVRLWRVVSMGEYTHIVQTGEYPRGVYGDELKHFAPNSDAAIEFGKDTYFSGDNPTSFFLTSSEISIEDLTGFSVEANGETQGIIGHWIHGDRIPEVAIDNNLLYDEAGNSILYDGEPLVHDIVSHGQYAPDGSHYGGTPC